jgi:hypothetical protein
VKAALICICIRARNTSQWDTCAPDIILHEAGGRMTDIFNNALRYNAPEIRNVHGVLASNQSSMTGLLKLRSPREPRQYDDGTLDENFLNRPATEDAVGHAISYAL